ncbi:hypothetical protein D9M69_580520 [compost metagenome]
MHPLPGTSGFKLSLRFKNGSAARFFKAVCKVNAREFANAKQVVDHVVISESALNNQEVAIVFKPRQEWPKMFRFLKLYRDPPDAKEVLPRSSE